MLDLTGRQREVVEAPIEARLFLEGVAGTGKTTAAIARIGRLLADGIPAQQILVMVPQRTLGLPYHAVLRRLRGESGALVDVMTFSGLARRMIDLFWPLVVERVGFGRPGDPPTFLTLETAQYFMVRAVGPLIEREGYFRAVRIDRNRLYSQILDNLNKAAVVGFPPEEIALRLKRAWCGERAQLEIFDQAQACALAFRRYCLEHNLLDFSLQLTLLREVLWPEPLCRHYLTDRYRYLFVDNVEEDTPVAHDLLDAWLGAVDGALLVSDQGAGYRSFLGADPSGAVRLQTRCDRVVTFEGTLVMSEGVQALAQAFEQVLEPKKVPEEVRPLFEAGGNRDSSSASAADNTSSADFPSVLHFEYRRFHPQMLDWVADTIVGLVTREGIAPGEIVVLAPFLSDALRYALSERLQARDVPVQSHRPSRALRDEPPSKALLTLAALAHPDWEIVPSPHDVANTLSRVIADMDPVRASLLTRIVYRQSRGKPDLFPFADINPDMKERITYGLGERYETLREWLMVYRAESGPEDALDYFMARLFGEVLSQPGFGFHQDIEAARVSAILIESVRKFRWIMAEIPAEKPLGREYLEMVNAGVIAAQYLKAWALQPEDAVLLAPAYTFLLSNRPVSVQFWLDIGGRGWWERLYQPLTHPFVLSRHWPVDRPWTDEAEYWWRQLTLSRLVLGLLRRCRRAVYLGLSQLSEQGYEQKGVLLQAVQRVLRMRGQLPDMRHP